MSPVERDVTELLTTATAVGGDAVARDADGCVVFVRGALAGERVSARVVEAKRSFRRAALVAVIDPAAGRVHPACPEVARGCGGCDFAHASHGHQQAAKASMVSDALARLGRVEPPVVDPGPVLATSGFRTTVRAGVEHGRAGLRRAASHELVDVASCRVAHPLVEDLLVNGRFGDAAEVTIRVGARTGERMVHVDGDAHGLDLPADVVVNEAIHEDVAGHRFRISPCSFFQARADGADALVATVGEAIADVAGGTLVDLCAGVGLFAATLGEPFDRVVAVESNRSAAADASSNLASLSDRVDVVTAPFERWRAEPADAVVADPSRSGLGRRGVSVIDATGAGVVVLVSCDVGSLGRDAGLLVAAGFELAGVTMVDLFPDTSHVEVVSVFRR